MMLNIGAIKHCIEMYKYHLCHEEEYEQGDANYREAIRALKEIELILIEKVRQTHSVDQLKARMKDIKIAQIREKMKRSTFENVMGELLEEGFFPLSEECETYMSEQVGSADLVILP
jgi:hypothetical protein